MRIHIGGNITLGGLPAILAYMAFGFCIYWLTDGSDLAWGSAWLWLCVVAWPAVIALYVLKWSLIALLAIVAVFVAIGVWLWVDDRIATRRLYRSLDGR